MKTFICLLKRLFGRLMRITGWPVQVFPTAKHQAAVAGARPPSMLGSGDSRLIRVFVSSTFLDMKEERDFLMTEAWPQLRRFCRERQVELVEVDLRWGIIEEQSTRQETLRLCLDEIHACRPFFVGILGERYGWVPGGDAFTLDLTEEQGWLVKSRGKSITELEILHGVLNNPSMAGRAFFYFRDPAYAAGRGPDFQSESVDDAGRLGALKVLIRATCVRTGIPLRENYPDARALATLVLEDMRAAVEAQFPIGTEPDPMTREARDHEVFAESRRRTYIVRPDLFSALDVHAAGSGGPLLLLGNSGGGKSALLANWLRHWRELHPADLIFQHYVGSTPDSVDHWRLIIRLMDQIKRWCDAPEELPTSDEGILRDLPLWLNRAREKARRDGVRCILVLDGFDQLESRDHARRLSWLPEQPFSGPLRLFASASFNDPDSEDLSAALQKPGWSVLHVESLPREERRRMIAEYLGRFSKKLEPRRADRLASAPQSGNPLYLKTILDELRVTGAYGHLDQSLDEYLTAPDIQSLFAMVMDRYKRDYEHDRAGLVAESLSLIWAARRGLSEAEILRLLRPPHQVQLPPALWSPLRAALEESLVDRGGILNFSHNHFRRAVAQAFQLGPKRQRELRLRLGDYFEAIPVSVRSCDELPRLLRQTEQRDRLRKLLLNVDAFHIIHQRDEKGLMADWVWLGVGSEAGIGPAYLDAFDRWYAANTNASLRLQSLNAHEIGEFLVAMALYAEAEKLLRRSLALIEQFSGHAAPEVAGVLRTIARLLRETDRLDEATELLRRSLKIDERWYTPDNPRLARDLHDLALSLHRIHHFEQAVHLFQRALNLLRIHPGPESEKYAATLAAMGDVLQDSGRAGEAEAAYRESIRIAERRVGSDSLLVAHATESLAGVLTQRGDMSGAETLFLSAVATWTALLGPDHPRIGVSMTNLAAMYYDSDRLADAERIGARSLSIAESHSGSSGREVATAASNLAAVLVRQGRLPEAEVLAERAVLLSEKGNEADHAAALNTLALVRAKQGDYKSADELWEKSLYLILGQSRRTGRLHGFAAPTVLNLIQSMRDRGVAPENAQERIHDVFSMAQALDSLPEVWSSVQSIIAGQPTVSRSGTDASPVDPTLLPAGQREEMKRFQTAISDQVEYHVARIGQGGFVPANILESCLDIYERSAASVAWKLHLSFEKREDIPQLRYSRQGNPVLLVVSLYCCDSAGVVEKLRAMSPDSRVGYSQLLAEIVNDWPSDGLSTLFHFVVCTRGAGFEYHSGIFDFQHRFKRRSTFSVMPVDLLSEFERNQMNLKPAIEP